MHCSVTLMVFTGKVNFQVFLEKHNKFQVPKLIREEYRIEKSQGLKVGVSNLRATDQWYFFHARMDQQGRISLPLLTLNLMSKDEIQNVPGDIFDVTLESSDQT